MEIVGDSSQLGGGCVREERRLSETVNVVNIRIEAISKGVMTRWLRKESNSEMHNDA